MTNHIFVFAGETSGDLHGEKILLHLKKLNPSLQVTGVGGPKMRATGMRCILPMEEFQVMGFIDVFLALPKLIRHFYDIAHQIMTLNPQVVLFIDYPGFNLRMARHLRKKGFKHKLCQYICPSVWAWGKKRISFMEDHLDLLLTILPFENQYFSSASLRVEYVGHPLVSRIKDHVNTTLTLPKDQKIIAVFSGSRYKEIKRNLPIQLKACQELRGFYPDLHIALSISQEHFRPLIEQIAQSYSSTLEISLVPPDKTYELMKAAYAAIAKSGTVTLELALHQVPTVVTYAISFLDLIIARNILKIRLPYYCLVNIIANKEIFPELFGPHFTQANVVTHMHGFLKDSQKRKECLLACQTLTHQMSDQDAAAEAAKQLLIELQSSSHNCL